MSNEERKHNRRKRRPILWHARLRNDAAEWECKIFDMNLTGAKVRIEDALPADTEVALDIPHIGVFRGQIAWQGDGQNGIRFTMSEDDVRFCLGRWVKSLSLDE